MASDLLNKTERVYCKGCSHAIEVHGDDGNCWGVVSIEDEGCVVCGCEGRLPVIIDLRYVEVGVDGRAFIPVDGAVV